MECLVRSGLEEIDFERELVNKHAVPWRLGQNRIGTQEVRLKLLHESIHDLIHYAILAIACLHLRRLGIRLTCPALLRVEVGNDRQWKVEPFRPKHLRKRTEVRAANRTDRDAF